MTVIKLLPFYAELGRRIGVGNTPLVELPAPGRNNRILAKCEYFNPGGSHYDRVYLSLLSELEREGKIHPHTTTLVEVTSGSAGISCSMLARILGYGCIVYLPENIPEARRRLIRANGAEVRVTSAKRFVGSAADEMGNFVRGLAGEKEGGVRLFYPPNHSRTEVSVQALAPVADEAVEQAGTAFTCFIGASGNGSTINGIGRTLRGYDPHMTVLAFDPVEAPTAYWLKYGKPPGEEPKLHELLGAGAFGTSFPLLEKAVREGVITDALKVSKEEFVRAAADLRKLGHAAGNTSAAAYHSARQYCAERSGETVLIVFYDRADRY